MSEPRMLSGRPFQSLGAKYEKVLPPLVDFAILDTNKSPELLCYKNPSKYNSLYTLNTSKETEM